MVYSDFMTKYSKSSEIMVNLNNSKRLGFISEDILFENSERRHVNMFSHCLDRPVKMDLNEELLRSLNEYVTADKVNHIQELLEKGADPNAIDSIGNRPIHLAIMNSPENIVLVQELIAFGANLNAVNSYGSTPLTFSLEKRCYKITKILIERGVNLSFQCHRGWTFLIIASMLGDAWSVRTLLEHGANVNAYDCNNKTALMFAVEGNYLKVIKELLAYGANTVLPNNTKEMVLCTYLKRPYPNLDIVNELLLHCASFSGLDSDINMSYVKIMKICLRGEPPYHACVRTVIKIQMLISPYPRTVEDCWYDFANDCCAEIRYMKGYNVSECSTVATLLQRSLKGSKPKESELEALLPFMASNIFPIYSDILRAHLRKPFIRKKFMNTFMYAKKDGKKDEAILLNSDINVKLMSYLGDDDVTNFVLAAHVKIKSPERNCFSCLYPVGESYSWNDLTIS
ncbi:unnamed protein product [Larinioides sclopetarius]|uniref:Ankyrin repeat protein n=1 Tax=Larinioides sclopetarius TaxID=280406 RepID=A0AAV2AFU9_9ARAC